MGPPSLVASASSRHNTRATLSNGGVDEVEPQQFPRRFPRTGSAFQCKIGINSTEYSTSRLTPQRMSIEYPHLSCNEAQTALESPSPTERGATTFDRQPSPGIDLQKANLMGYETNFIAAVRGGRLVHPRQEKQHDTRSTEQRNKWDLSSESHVHSQSKCTASATKDALTSRSDVGTYTSSRGLPKSIESWALEMRSWHKQQSLLENVSYTQHNIAGRKTTSRYKKRPMAVTETLLLPFHEIGPFSSFLNLDLTRPVKKRQTTNEATHRNSSVGDCQQRSCRSKVTWMETDFSETTDPEQCMLYQYEHHRGCSNQAASTCLAGWSGGKAARTIRRRHRRHLQELPPMNARNILPGLFTLGNESFSPTPVAAAEEDALWLWRDFHLDSIVVVSGDYRNDSARISHPVLATHSSRWNEDDLKATWAAVLACIEVCLEQIERNGNGLRPFVSSVAHFLLQTCQLPSPVSVLVAPKVREVEAALEKLLNLYAVARQHQAKLIDLIGEDNLDLEVMTKQIEIAATVGLEIDELEHVKHQMSRVMSWQNRLDNKLGRCTTLDDTPFQHCNLTALEKLLAEGLTHGIRCKSLVGLEEKIERAHFLEDRITKWKTTSTGTKENVKFIAALVRDILRLKILSPTFNEMIIFHQAAESWVERATIAIRSRISLDEIKMLVERGLAMPLDLKEFLEKLQSRVAAGDDWISSFEKVVPGLQAEVRTNKLELIRRIRAELSKSSWQCSKFFELATAGSRIPVEIDCVKVLHVELDARTWTSKAKKWIPSDNADDASRKGKLEDIREHLSKANALRERLTLSSAEKEAWVLDGEAQLTAIVQASDDWMNTYESILDSNWTGEDSVSYTIDQLRGIVDEGQSIYANLGNGASRITRILLQAETWLTENGDLFVRCNLRDTAPPNSPVELSELKAAASTANSDVSLYLKDVAELLALVRKAEGWMQRASQATGQKGTSRAKAFSFSYDDLVALVDEAKGLPIESSVQVALLQEQCRLVEVWQHRAVEDLEIIRLSYKTLREAIIESYGPAPKFRRVTHSVEQKPMDETTGNKYEDGTCYSDVGPNALSLNGDLETILIDDQIPTGSLIVSSTPTTTSDVPKPTRPINELCNGESIVLAQIKSFCRPPGIASSIITAETKIASELKVVERWCFRSIKYLSNNRDVFDKRCFGAFDRFVAEGKALVKQTDTTACERMESNCELRSRDQLRAEWRSLVSDQLERLESLLSDRNEFISWCKKTEVILNSEDRRPSATTLEELARKSLEFPDVCDVTERVRTIWRRANAWINSARIAISSSKKMSVTDAKTLLGKGEDIGFTCDEMKTLRNGLKAARSWLNRVKRCKVDRGSEHHSTVQLLVEEHMSLLCDLSDDATTLQSALTNYCLCRRPYDGFMIACDECEDWFHGPCVGVSESRADRVNKYVCLRCLVSKTYKSSSMVCIDIVHKWVSKKDLKKHRQIDSSKHKRRVRKETKDLEKLQSELATLRHHLESRGRNNVSPNFCREVTPTECESLSVTEEKESPISLFQAESSLTVSPVLPAGLSNVVHISSNPESSAESIAAVTESNDTIMDPVEVEQIVGGTSISKDEILSRIAIAEASIHGYYSRLEELTACATKQKDQEDGEDLLSAALRTWVLRLKTLVLVPSTSERAALSMPKRDGSLSDAMISLDDDANRLGLSDINDIHVVRNSFQCMAWCLRAMSILTRQPNASEILSLVDQASLIELPDEKSFRVIKSLSQRVSAWESKVIKALSPVPGEVRPFNVETLKSLSSIGVDIPVFIPLEARLTTVIEDRGSRHCICGGPSDGRFMVGCDGCDKWFHGHCVDVSINNDLSDWKCPSCVGKAIESMNLQVESFHDKFDCTIDVDMDDGDNSDVDVSSKAPNPDRFWPPFGLLGSETAREVLGKESCLLLDSLDVLKIPMSVVEPNLKSSGAGVGFGPAEQAQSFNTSSLHMGSANTSNSSLSGVIGFGSLTSCESAATMLGFGSRGNPVATTFTATASLGYGSRSHPVIVESTSTDTGLLPVSRQFPATMEIAKEVPLSADQLS